MLSECGSMMESQIHLLCVGFFPGKPTPSPGVTVERACGCGAVCGSMRAWFAFGAGNKPRKSPNEIGVLLDSARTAQTGSAADTSSPPPALLQVPFWVLFCFFFLFFFFHFSFYLLYLVWLFSCFSNQNTFQEGFPVHLHQMNVWCYEKLSISSKLICVDFCMEKKS